MVKFPTSDVTVGAATSASGVPDADAVIARSRWRFKVCHNKAMATDPAAEGDVKLAFELDADGKVKSCTVASTTAPTSLAKCAAAAGTLIQFAKPSGAPSFALSIRFKVKLP
ncbi:MAG: AgmX/PglI C-terminal domain-containing protein [Polyangiales bacterium]